MTTKRIVREPKFIAEAKTDEVGSLAYTLSNSFGMTMDRVLEIAHKIFMEQDEKMLLLAVTSAANIRGNVDHAVVDPKKYPELLIDGNRGTGDNFNFSALRMVGFAFTGKSSHVMAARVNGKAGNALSGGTFPATTAGKINSEAFNSWSEDEKKLYVSADFTETTKWVNTVFDTVSAKSAAFAAKVKA